jgi:hypothetical protein
MSEILIARFKNKREADAVTKLIKERSVSSKLVRGNNLEDMVLGELIDEGMKEKRNYSMKIFMKALDTQMRSLKK